MYDPGNVGVVGGFERAYVRFAVDGLESADYEEETHHEEGSDEHGWSTTESIEVENSGKREGHIEDVLD